MNRFGPVKVLVFHLAILFVHAQGQSNPRLDSLIDEAKRGISKSPKQSIIAAAEAVQLCKEANYYPGIITGSIVKATAYYYDHQYDASLGLFMDVIKQLEAADPLEQLPHCYYFICKIHRHHENLDLSIQYGRKSYNRAMQYGDLSEAHKAASGMANAHRKKQQIDSFFYYTRLDLRLLEKLQDTTSMAIVFENLSSVFIDQKQTDSAEYYLKRAIRKLEGSPQIAQNRNIRKAFAGMQYELSRIALLKNDLKLAEQLAVKALEQLILDDAKREITSVTKHLADLYKLLNQPEKARQTLELYITTKDEIINEENSLRFAEMETKYETEKKEQQIQAQQLIIEKEKREKVLYTSLLILFLLILILFIQFIRNRHKHKTQLLVREHNEIALNKVLEAEEKERGRIARDLHDGIVQDLTAIKNQLGQSIAHLSGGEKANMETLVNDLDRASKEIRDISYQMMPLTLKEFGLEKALDGLLSKMLSGLNIAHSLDVIGLNNRLPEKIEVSVYRICQELLHIPLNIAVPLKSMYCCLLKTACSPLPTKTMAKDLTQIR